MLVLKIIGIVLLSILAILLLLIALVLFVPVRYDATLFAHGTDLEKLKGRARVYWLLHLVSVSATYENKQSRVLGRIAFYKLFGDKKEKEEKPSKKKNKGEDTKDPDDEFFKDYSEPAFSSEDVSDAAIEVERPPEQGTFKQDSPEQGPQLKEEKEEKKEKKKREKKKKKKKEKKAKKPKNPNSLPRRLKRLYDKREKVARVYEKEKKNLEVAIRRTGRILKKILPRKCMGYVEFGAEDPATTGKILGYVSALYALTGPLLNLYPDFTEKKLKADVKLKGHFTLFSVGLYLLQVPFNKELRRAYRYLKKLSMEDSKEETKDNTVGK